MSFSARIDTALSRAVDSGGSRPAPPQLAKALHHATCPGGARIRPTILLSVAAACGEDIPALSDRAAAALELIHCASLVHDDLPAFDDAAMRRGKPSVHCEFSEPLAILTGDSLIVMAFETLAGALGEAPGSCERIVGLTSTLARHTGTPYGICAGQGWESEALVDLAAYHRSKTGALFMAATRMGAISAGQEADPWEDLGARIGEAFQIADDLRDALMSPEDIGKPVGQDARHDRPNAVAEFGVDGAVQRLRNALDSAVSSIPACPGEAMLAKMVMKQAERLIPMDAPAATTRKIRA